MRQTQPLAVDSSTIKQSATRVEAVLRLSRDGGSIPPGSIRFLAKIHIDSRLYFAAGKGWSITPTASTHYSTDTLIAHHLPLWWYCGWLSPKWNRETENVATHTTENEYPFTPIPFTQVRMEGGFWGQRLDTNRTVTVWYDFGKCEETGRIDNFTKAGGLMPGTFRGQVYDDSDVYKVIEGASYTLATTPDPRLDQYLDDLITKIAAAQEDDGYLYTYRTLKAGDAAGPDRWTALISSHELYNAGHMYEAAVAHFLATRKSSLLKVALKNAELINRIFGPNAGQRADPPGHQEIEIGLVKLYRVTHDKRWLALAQFFLDVRGKAIGGRRLYGENMQDHKPILEQTDAVGHAVRAAYMYSGMADVAALTGESPYISAIDRIWRDVVGSKLYITGGIGSRVEGEAFGDAYELPNREAYNETCAAIANCLWNYRMFLLHGKSQYFDIFERTLYNAFLAGVSMKGDTFFYPNPLAADGTTGFNHGHRGRAPWFNCSCCPVNVVRFFPSLPGFVYAVRDAELYVNLYAHSQATTRLNGSEVSISQKTAYPWDGTIELVLHLDKACEFSLLLRIPGWVDGRPVPSNLYHYLDAANRDWRVVVNGVQVEAQIENGYARVSRKWKSGDRVVLRLPLEIRRVLANDKVQSNRSRVAIERGPIVYCVESVDNHGSVSDLILPDDARLTATSLGHQLSGITAIHGEGVRLIRTVSGEIRSERTKIAAIPYYAWAHRGESSMAVWLSRDTANAIPGSVATVT